MELADVYYLRCTCLLTLLVRGLINRKSFSLDPGIVSIFATGFGGRRTPDHSTGDIDDPALQLNIQVPPFQALPARKLQITGGGIGCFDRYELHHRGRVCP